MTNFSLSLDNERAMQEPEADVVVAAETGDIRVVERILAIHPEWVSTKDRI